MTAIHDITPPDAFPFLRSEGSPREVGRAHGRAFGDRILTSIGVYRHKFDRIGLPWDEALAVAGRGGELIRGFDAALADELEGIAEGAGVDRRELLAINIRTSLTRLVNPPVAVAETHECTTAAILGSVTADGHTLMAQNWDQSGALQAHTVMIEQHVPGEPALLFLTEAGTLFRHGMNDAGVGICGNALFSSQKTEVQNAAIGSLVRRRALRQRTAAEAHRAIRDTPRATSQNHLLADAGGHAVDVEVVPARTYAVEPQDGILVHSNHFQNVDAQGDFVDRAREMHPDSLYRDCRVRDHLAARRGRITIADVKAALQDHHGHPMSVCRHPNPAAEEVGYTLASTVMDLDDRRMITAPGPACVGTYTEYRFS